MTQEYDNTNSGAVYGDKADPTILSGPYTGPEGEALRAVIQLDLDSGDHTLRVHKKGAKGQAIGKPIYQGVVSRVTSKDRAAPKARGVMVDAKGEPVMDVVCWGIFKEKNDPATPLVGLQIKQDNPKDGLPEISV